MIQIPNLVILELTFKIISPVKKLPFYHGAQWNGLFRDLIKKFVSKKTEMGKLSFCIHPIETGIHSYKKGECVNLGISFPEKYLEKVFLMLGKFNSQPAGTGHFSPDKLLLMQAKCKISKEIFQFNGNNHIAIDDLTNKILFLAEETVQREMNELLQFDKFSLIFFSPLRLKSSASYKEATGNTYISPDFFNREKFDIAAHMLGNMGHVCSDSGLKVTGGNFIWHDMSYGGKSKTAKSYGGILGKIVFRGKLKPEDARAMVIGQYRGLGKNRTFGFGFYHIPEINEQRCIEPYHRASNIFNNIISFDSLKTALYNLPNSSPGLDGLSVSDLKKSGDEVIVNISNSLRVKNWKQGDLKKYKIEKPDGSSRNVIAFNVIDKLVHRSVADNLQPVIEKLLSESSWAYRKGLNRNGAVKAVQKAFNDNYTTGVKADINAFFESVDIEILCNTVDAMFPFDSVCGLIRRILEDAKVKGVKGIPQGSPLSPILSNLYLDKFDRQMNKAGFRLIRYGDDFVALCKTEGSINKRIEIIEGLLLPLGLELKKTKTQNIDKSNSFKFLGYEIIAGSFQQREKEREKQSNWLPVFKPDWVDGLPVYLSSICRGAWSSGPYLVIKDEDGKQNKIPWNRISRIIIVGRSSFSGGVVYRAVRETVPVCFIDVMGRTTGTMNPSFLNNLYYEQDQLNFLGNEEFCLKFAREIISAKIHNTHTLLKRNSQNLPNLRDLSKSAAKAKNQEQLRGFEGAAAKIYFDIMKGLVKPFEFEKRVYHPPEGAVNAMLSFGYTLLYNRIASALLSRGLNPKTGFFHRQSGRHFALASDMVEELRHIAERIIFALIHLKEISVDDFTEIKKNNITTCRLNGTVFRKYIRRYEMTMDSVFTDSNGEKYTYNGYIDEMISSLIRSMRLGTSYRALRIVSESFHIY